MMVLKASVAEQYPTVTTVSEYGGIGIGHMVDDEIFTSGGNGFYYPAISLKTWHNDNGAMYRDRLNKLMIPPAYKN